MSSDFIERSTTRFTCRHVKNLHIRYCKYVRWMFSELYRKAPRSCDCVKYSATGGSVTGPRVTVGIALL